MSEDTNLIFVLIGGQEVKVNYPDRIGLQYVCPWLGSEGNKRVWNIDVPKVVSNYQSGKDYQTESMFIIGKWGTSFDEKNGVKQIIPVGSVVSIKFEPLTIKESN